MCLHCNALHLPNNKFLCLTLSLIAQLQFIDLPESCKVICKLACSNKLFVAQFCPHGATMCLKRYDSLEGLMLYNDSCSF